MVYVERQSWKQIKVCWTALSGEYMYKGILELLQKNMELL